MRLNLRETLFTLCLIICFNGCNSNSGRSSDETVNNSNVGLVIKIIDGDTFDILTENKVAIRIRMDGIDAPEKGQPFYKKAKEFLGQLCFSKNVRIEKVDIDSHNRMVAKSFLDDGTSLSYEMVKNGFAWHFKRYSKDQNLADLESQARNKKTGLWVDEKPIAPWDIRAHRRSGKKDNEE